MQGHDESIPSIGTYLELRTVLGKVLGMKQVVAQFFTVPMVKGSGRSRLFVL
jgi:hypothetical protein